jgi:hypothetical protein
MAEERIGLCRGAVISGSRSQYACDGSLETLEQSPVPDFQCGGRGGDAVVLFDGHSEQANARGQCVIT